MSAGSTKIWKREKYSEYSKLQKSCKLFDGLDDFKSPFLID